MVDGEILVKDSSKIEVYVMDGGELLHWNHKPKGLISHEDGLQKIHYVSLVDIDPRKYCEPHSHNPGTDEVWYLLEGKSKMMLGDMIINHEPGTSIVIPPDGKTEHSTLTGLNPASFFFFMYNSDIRK